MIYKAKTSKLVNEGAAVSLSQDMLTPVVIIQDVMLPDTIGPGVDESGNPPDTSHVNYTYPAKS